MFSHKIKMSLSFLLALVMGISLLCTTAFATTVNVLDGKVSVTDSANSNTVSGGTVTITAKGSLFSKKTNNITITNETDNKAQLSFDYTADKANSFKIAGATAAASGSYTVLLEAGASLAITLVSNSGLSNTTATLKLSNFSLIVAATSSKVTINYDSILGSVTVGGSSVASGITQEVSLDEGIALAATAESGATFLGWVDGDGKIIDKTASLTLKPAEDMTVKAVFGGTDKPCFGVGALASAAFKHGFMELSSSTYYTVGDGYIFDDLNAAVNTAAASSNKGIVLLNDGTLPAGDYTIPAGITLLIPFDGANTTYKDMSQFVEGTAYKSPTRYRTLTMADGAHLIINGEMSVSGKHRVTNGNSLNGNSPSGPVGFVDMNTGSSITVNNGGKLYAYGYIIGSGTVTAESGATVYEMLQIMDFRGGSQTTDMDNRVFPFTQYYVQNIEVPLTLKADSKEYANLTPNMTGGNFCKTMEFVGSNGVFKQTGNGYATKWYDGATDRLMIDTYGSVEIAQIEIELAAGQGLKSKDYDFAINGNITITAHSGSNITVGQCAAFLPGSELIIEEGAVVTLKEDIKVYVYDVDEWGTYCGASNKKLIPIGYAPTKKYTRKEADLADVKVVINGAADLTQGFGYTTTGGANICSEREGSVIKIKSGTQTVTYQLVQNTGYTEIPITPAKLKNADGSYTETQKATENDETYGYTYTNGRWICDIHTPGEDIDVCKADWTCVACGATVEASSHTEVIDAAVDATCSAPGLTEGKHCSVCDTVLVEQTEIPMVAHSWTDATCETPKTCSACGATEGSALGHSYGEDNVCDRCGAVKVAQVITPDTSGTEGGSPSTTTPHTTLQGALDSVGGTTGSTITLSENVSETGVTLPENTMVTIDLAGKNVTNPVTIPEDSVLQGMNTGSGGTVTVASGSVERVAAVTKDADGKLYASNIITTDSDGNATVSFDYVAAKAKDYYVEVRRDGTACIGIGMGFAGTFAETSSLKAMGFELTVGEQTVEVWLDGIPEVGSYWSMEVAEFVKTNNITDDPYGAYVVHGALKFSDGTVYLTNSTLKFNFKSVVETYYKTAADNAKSVIEDFDLANNDITMTLT